MLAFVRPAQQRSILRNKRRCPVRICDCKLGRLVEQPRQITVWIKAVFLSGLDQAEHDSAALCSAGRVCEQEVLTRDHKRLDAALGAVVAQFNTTVLQIGGQIGPLVFQIVQGDPKLGLWRGIPGICPCQHYV